MLKNYLLVTVRNLFRNKFYSLINIFGLATGIACFILITLFIQDELSYDRFHSKADRIYRVTEKIDVQEGQGENSSSNPFPVAKAIRTDFPQLVEEAVRFFNFQAPTLTLQYKDKKINEKRLFFADSSVFKVFDFPLEKGNSLSALTRPNSIVISRAMATRYFGEEEPVGKTLRFEGVIDLNVSGVMKDIPEQSHIHFDALISFPTVAKLMGPNYDRSWVWNPCWTYVLLREGVSKADLEKQFPGFVQKYYPDFIKPQIRHSLQPLKDIHLTSRLDYEIEPNGDKSDIYVFSIIGVVILIIACINFMNLTTARSAKRAREVGMRKVLGAYKSQLIWQFLGESVLLSFVAVIVALVLIELLLPLFNSLSGKQLALNLLSNPALLVSLVSVWLGVGLLSGIYPAFFLSSFDPLKVLKGSVTAGNRSKVFRKSLVVVQFAISLALIVSTMIIYLQLRFLRNAGLGFDKEQVVIMPARPPVVPRYESIKNELLLNSSIQEVTVMNEIIGRHHNTHEYNYEGMQPGKWIYFPSLLVNESFVKTFKIKLLAGRDFSKDIKTDDSLGVLINEAMVKHLNWGTPEQALGKQFYTPRGRERVIGVVQNFNFVSLLEPIGPFVLDLPHRQDRNFWSKYIAVRIAPGDYASTLAYMEKVWSRFAPAYPFEYTFLDQDLNMQYRAQDNLGKLVGYFSILAVFIACLGLFALASFTAEQRTKEIGIRKVLGASERTIVTLLSREFLKLVLIANLVAWPVTYLVMSNWLKDFAYRIDISFGVFVMAALITLVIALCTVIFQALKAALSNPVNAIKYE
jgi:putative ABC transport system permease protein